jgi:hypothetical protein
MSTTSRRSKSSNSDQETLSLLTQSPRGVDLYREVFSEIKKGPNCWGCRHFQITWDTRMPYGCRLMGFKTKILPSIEVLRADGHFCLGFEEKELLQAEQKQKPKRFKRGGRGLIV